VQLVSGDIQGASHWADQIQLGKDFELHEDQSRLTLARIRLTQGRYSEVERLLAGAAPPKQVGNRIAWQLESDLLVAVAIAGQQRQPEALALLAACLEKAAPEGYLRVFLDVGEPVRELLAAYLRSDGQQHEAFARKVLAAFPSPGEVAGISPGGLVEPLSERELEVLQLMALGNTNKQIAAQLIISPGTVKAHTANIYRKLDVANRTEAVTCARQLHILS
jgi:LuxR family maltose regulon positive regulatory protein